MSRFKFADAKIIIDGETVGEWTATVEFKPAPTEGIRVIGRKAQEFTVPVEIRRDDHEE